MRVWETDSTPNEKTIVYQGHMPCWTRLSWYSAGIASEWFNNIP